MRNTYKIVVILVSILFITAACSNESRDKKEKKETVTYNDKLNKDVEIPKDPKRIVDLNKKGAGNLLLLNKKPVAVDTNIDFGSYMEKKMKDVKKVDSNNIEGIAKTKPDLIFALKGDKNIKKLKKLAPTVIVDYDANYKKMIKIQGKVLNKEKRVEKILEDWDKKIQKDKEDLKGKLSDKSITVIQDAPKAKSVLGKNAGRSTEILYDAYGLKVPNKIQRKFDNSGQNFFLFNKENFSDIDSDYISIVLPDGKKSELFKENNWKNLNAVQSNKVIKLNVNDVAFSDFSSLNKARKIIKKQLMEMN